MDPTKINSIKRKIKELQEELETLENSFYPEYARVGPFRVKEVEEILAGKKPFETIIDAFNWGQTPESSRYWDTAYKQYKNTPIEKVPYEYTYKLMTWVINYYRVNGGKTQCQC